MELAPCSVCQAPAAWVCPKCGPKCASHVRRQRGPRMRFRCPADGEDAELLRKPRAQLHRFLDRLRLAALGPLTHPRVSVSTAVTALLFFLAFLAASSLPLAFLVSAVALTITLSLGLRLLRATAEDEPFEWPAPAEAMDEVVMPLARVLAAAALPTLALLIGIEGFALKGASVSARSLALRLATAPTFWLASLFAVGTMPLMLLHAARTTEWSKLFNPVHALFPVRRFPREYGWISLFAGGSFLVAFLLGWALPAGRFEGFVVAVLASYGAYATFLLLGQAGWLHPEELGFGEAEDALVDLGDPEAPTPEDSAPEKPAEPAPAPVPTASVESQLVALLDQREVAAALSLYRSVAKGQEPISPSVLLRCGQAAASQNELALAMTALLAAGRGDGGDSAKALVIAGRVLDERMRDQSGAKRLYTQVLQRFPGTPAAQFAEKQLADPRFMLSDK